MKRKKATQSAKVEVTPSRIVSASVMRTLNLGNFESIKIGFDVTEEIKSDADVKESLDALFEVVEDKINEKMESYEDAIADENVVGDDDDAGDDDGDDDDVGDDDDAGDDDSDDDDVTEEAINKMKRPELIQLIKDEDLKDEINPKKFKKIGDLRTVIIDELFEDDGDGADDDAGDDEFDDDDEWGDDD